MHLFHKFIWSWNSTCFGQFLCLSSGIHSLYTQQWYMSYRFVDSFQAGPGCSCSTPVRHIPLLNVQWMNSWWQTEELSKTCRVSWPNKFVKLVCLFGFITKKFVTMHGHTNVKFDEHVYLCFQLIFTTNSTVLLEKLAVDQQIKTCPTFYGTKWSVPFFPRACHCFRS
jgi:hypothetical protein